MNNRQLAAVFQTIADLMTIKGESTYRTLAYQRAAESILDLGRDVREYWENGQLQDIPGVGEAISAKIDELLRTGELEFLNKLTAEIPIGLVEVLKVGDVGPKKAALFWQELNITTVEGLEQAAKAGKLRQLKGMGEKSENRILESIEALKRRATDRISIGSALPIAERLLAYIRLQPAVERAEIGGSLRRFRETIGDIDIMVASSEPGAVMEAFLEGPSVSRVKSSGDTKASVELVDGTAVQVWVHPPERFGSALQYATGSQSHNVRLRELALKQGISLSEHGFKREDGSEILCRDETKVYEQLGLPWIPPEMREDRGEIQAAQADGLPALIELSDLKGDLQSHSDWSDGSCTLLEMAQGARAAGLEYLVITDHSRSLGVANGLSIERVSQQKQAIGEVQLELGDTFRLLAGIETEILADGTLDYPDEVLAQFDIVLASLHTSLRQDGARITERLLTAIRNPHVDIIGHPTGRLIGSRDPADLDMESIFKAASEHQVILEINANPERLDLKDVHARRAVECGVMLAINSDAHHPDHFELLRYGIGAARRAWVRADQVINTRPVDAFLAWIETRGK